MIIFIKRVSKLDFLFTKLKNLTTISSSIIIKIIPGGEVIQPKAGN